MLNSGLRRTGVSNEADRVVDEILQGSAAEYKDSDRSRGRSAGPVGSESLSAELRLQLLQHEHRFDNMLALHLKKIIILVETQVVPRCSATEKDKATVRGSQWDDDDGDPRQAQRLHFVSQRGNTFSIPSGSQEVSAALTVSRLDTSPRAIPRPEPHIAVTPKAQLRELPELAALDAFPAEDFEFTSIREDDLPLVLPNVGSMVASNKQAPRLAAWGDGEKTNGKLQSGVSGKSQSHSPGESKNMMKSNSSLSQSKTHYADQLDILERAGRRSACDEEFDDMDLTWTNRLRLSTKRVFRSRPAEYVVSLLIVSNAVCIGAQVDWDVKHLHETQPTPFYFSFFEAFFQVVFFAELVLRIIVEGIRFLSISNRSLGWNLFDGCLVLTSLFERTLTLAEEIMASQDVPTANVSFIRLFRILRLVRVIRIVRVLRFFRDLRVMVSGIMSSLKSLLWALLLLFLFMYIVSICLIQIGTDVIAGGEQQGKTEAEFIKYYGSLASSVYTLYMAIMGGIDWSEAADPLIAMHPTLIMVFMLYIAFGVLCVLNIVTGVFVDNAHAITQNDEDHVRMELLANKRSFYEKVRKIFEEADADFSGRISRDQFEALCGRADVIACLDSIGIDMMVTTPKQIFQIFDFDGCGSIDLEGFASGLQKIHGPARSLDIIHLSHSLREIRKGVFEFAAHTGYRLSTMEGTDISAATASVASMAQFRSIQPNESTECGSRSPSSPMCGFRSEIQPPTPSPKGTAKAPPDIS